MLKRVHHWRVAICVFLLVSVCIARSIYAAPYAAMVMDAKTGQVLHSRNADTRLHPASLTKMMTLYVVFQAVENGEISLDTKVKISRNAANEEPSKLGLKSGQRIALRYLIRGAAVKSANDAATALGEAISGSEAAFTKRMTQTARLMGMKNTTFKNAHGLTQSGHLSTARDMTILGRRLFYDFPDYYNLFSRRSTHAGVRTVYNTNRKLLSNYRGADGIKTGYTRAAGFNLVASAERGQKRVIATVFGGKTSASRNARVAELLNMGFTRVNTRLAEVKPAKLSPVGGTGQTGVSQTAQSGSIRTSPIPKLRSKSAETQPEDVLLAILDKQEVETALEKAIAEEEAQDAVTEIIINTPKHNTIRPVLRSNQNTIKLASNDTKITFENSTVEPLRIVSRKSTSGRAWAVQLGAFVSKYEAEKTLLKTALSNLGPLANAEQKIAPTLVNGKHLYRARFIGLSQADAKKACSRLRARSQTCITVSPES